MDAEHTKARRAALLAADRKRRRDARRREAEGREWKPDWTIAPSETLREWMDYNGLTVPVLAVACGGKTHIATSAAHIQAVLDREPYGELTAMVLSMGTMIPARFWLALEHNYRAGLAAGLTDASST